MKKAKEISLWLLGERGFLKLREAYAFLTLSPALLKNFSTDARLFYKHSNVFRKDTFEKIEALIVLRYHSIEKGLLHDPIRFKFSKERVEILIDLLSKREVIKHRNKSQIFAAYQVMCSYYELHKNNKIDISDYYPEKVYKEFKSCISEKIQSVICHEKNSYFDYWNRDFYQFSNSRSSVRNYSGEHVPLEKINAVIDLAKNAPSVCNRQPTKVYCINNKQKIDEILEIQGGLKGYDENISQLLVVTSDRSAFFSIGERNQLYIDGGIFLMNLLYALHYYQIAACPAHWGMEAAKDKKMVKLLDLPESEKIISLVSIGIVSNEFKTCLSLRRSSDEILRTVN